MVDEGLTQTRRRGEEGTNIGPRVEHRAREAALQAPTRLLRLRESQAGYRDSVAVGSGSVKFTFAVRYERLN